MSFHPQTPQSPSQPSPATHLDPMAAASSVPTGPATLPTPAHSVTGSICHQSDATMAEESPHKRKRTIDDVGERDQKKVQYDHKLGIEDLHLDVGPKYLLLSRPHDHQFPVLTRDLYEDFNLERLAAEVAREKPNGEKNALRKTYKGHIKRLGVAGHFDVQKKKEDAPSEFMAMLQMPELEWSVHQVRGREIGDGLSEATQASLGRAVTLSRGQIARSVWDTSVLGDMAPSHSSNNVNGETSKPSAGPAKATAPSTPAAATTPSAMDRPRGSSNLPPGADPARPRRNIKKRTYGDSSYEGYGEGFPDDDGGADTGYSTGEGEGGQKRRKKQQQTSGATPPYPPVRQHSYGPGMVGA
ncbi:Mediator complex, subunit Med19 [Cordyceps fumosorosea ARSEF 2679]|uniref:Mediator of RNA polymerase II transcription subunit 19 n=1 Tax=Cordyceps fumosorosea (strain ARSEF 2679) TaxID=1081104 RepID=A0A167ZLP1_CORFA|nr:Mediator complex, subunit Med19 [Cordyceps fumosorosea ARSEF 2679]OAA67665.1 Mediator complex, subunit Med19 [Cordyceps fumosorosea ARSEF 2679]